MGFVSGLLGAGGGASGSGFAGPQGTDPQQLQTAYNQTQSGINQQQNFVNALAAQNGLGNQSSVFNQLQGVAKGQGPNPAQAMLNQATGANTANQAALMAGQRGAGQNVGLIARQAAQQGAANQQNAAGQGASMQANQSLGALNSLGNIANTQVGQQQAGLTGLNQNSLQQQANLLGIQSNINSANAGLAGNVQGQQGSMFGGLMNSIGGAAGNLFGGSAAPVASPLGPVAGGAGDASGLVGDGTMLAARGGAVRMASGGSPNSDLSAGIVPQDQPVAQGPQSTIGQMFNPDAGSKQAAAPKSSGSTGAGIGNLAGAAVNGLVHWGVHEALPAIGNFFSGIGQGVAGLGSEAAGGVGDLAGGAGDVVGGAAEIAPGIAADAAPAAVAAAKGGQVPALVSPGEVRIKAKDVPAVAAGKKSPMSGEKIPGKPKVGGAKNSYANDTVRKTLSEGDIILPRSVTQAKHPHWEAHKFVSAIMAKNKGKLK